MKAKPAWQNIAGSVLLLIGIFLISTRFVPLELALLSILIAIGILLIGISFRNKQISLTSVGLGLFIVGTILMYSLNPAIKPDARSILILLSLLLAAGWMVLWLFTRLTNQFQSWAVVPALISLLPAGVLIFTKMTILDFTLWIGVGLGIIFIVWGLYKKYFGLIIPGCLLITAGPALYLAWQSNIVINPISRTGFMLAILGLGWFLISFFARFQFDRFVWWPLIPGSVMLVSGIGLYVGGNPSNSMDFLLNTGAFVLLIIGLYLLLFRNTTDK